WKTPIEALSKRIVGRYQSEKVEMVPNRFLADIVNPGTTPVSLIFSGSVDRARLNRAVTVDQLPRMMSVTIVAEPGHSRHVINVDGMRDILTSGLPFNLAIAPEGDEEAHLI